MRRIAAQGGLAAHEKGTAHVFTPEETRIGGQKGGNALKAARGADYFKTIGSKSWASRTKFYKSKQTGLIRPPCKTVANVVYYYSFDGKLWIKQTDLRAYKIADILQHDYICVSTEEEAIQ